MTHDDFDEGLRRGLATLAREAVPGGDAEAADDLPVVQPLRAGHDRRIGNRVLAAVVAAIVAVGSGLIAIALHDDSKSPRVETPRPAWTKVARFPLLPRSEQTAVFTGREVVVWGGRSDPSGPVISARRANGPVISLGDGAAYDVATNAWQVLPPAPIARRWRAVGVWTGSEVLLVGGMREGAGASGGDGFLRDGAAYDPAHHRWRRIPDAPACPAFGAWTGARLVVAGYCADKSGAPLVMAAYDPARDTWTTLPPFAGVRQLVAAGGRVYAWTGAPTNRGAVLDPGARHWSALPPLPNQEPNATFAVAYKGQFAVAGLLQRPSDDPPRDRASVDIFDVNARTWHHYETTGVTAMTNGSELASGPGALVWSSGIDVTSFAVSPASGRAEWSGIAEKSLGLGSSSESFVSIGDRRFFLWGGLLSGTEHNPTNYPTSAGAILQLP